MSLTLKINVLCYNNKPVGLRDHEFWVILYHYKFNTNLCIYYTEFIIYNK